MEGEHFVQEKKKPGGRGRLGGRGGTASRGEQMSGEIWGEVTYKSGGKQKNNRCPTEMKKRPMGKEKLFLGEEANQ